MPLKATKTLKQGFVPCSIILSPALQLATGRGAHIPPFRKRLATWSIPPEVEPACAFLVSPVGDCKYIVCFLRAASLCYFPFFEFMFHFSFSTRLVPFSILSRFPSLRHLGEHITHPDQWKCRGHTSSSELLVASDSSSCVSF